MSTSISYESILESISGGFFAMDAKYCVTYWNKAAETGTGMPATDVLGRSVFDVFPNARDAMLGEKYRLAMETRTFQSFESAYRDERFEKWFDVRIYPAENGLSVFFQDVTEHKQEQMQKEILVEISKAVNKARSVDDLSQRCATVIAAMEEIPEHLVCVYLFDARAGELRLVAPASLDIDFPIELVHQHVTPDAVTLAARSAFQKEPVVTGTLAEGTLGRLLDGTLETLPLRSVVRRPAARAAGSPWRHRDHDDQGPIVHRGASGDPLRDRERHGCGTQPPAPDR